MLGCRPRGGDRAVGSAQRGAAAGWGLAEGPCRAGRPAAGRACTAGSTVTSQERQEGPSHPQHTESTRVHACVRERCRHMWAVHTCAANTTHGAYACTHGVYTGAQARTRTVRTQHTVPAHTLTRCPLKTVPVTSKPPRGPLVPCPPGSQWLTRPKKQTRFPRETQAFGNGSFSLFRGSESPRRSRGLCLPCRSVGQPPSRGGGGGCHPFLQGHGSHWCRSCRVLEPRPPSV